VRRSIVYIVCLFFSLQHCTYTYVRFERLQSKHARRACVYSGFCYALSPNDHWIVFKSSALKCKWERVKVTRSQLCASINSVLRKNGDCAYERSPVFPSVSRKLIFYCHKMQSTQHCLYDILPPKTQYDHILRNRGHNFTLPQCKSNLFRFSFLNSCLIVHIVVYSFSILLLLYSIAVSYAVHCTVVFDTRLLCHFNKLSQSVSHVKPQFIR